MNRAVLKLTQNEAEELIQNFNIEKYMGMPLSAKIQSVDLISDGEKEIFLSEDEMEIIMDEIGIVDQNINPILYSAINKLINLKAGLVRPIDY